MQFLIVLFVVHLILHLHGAGLRRPFGSVASIKFLPQWLRDAHALVFAVDCAVIIYVVAIWYLLARELGLLTVVVFGFVFSVFADRLADRIGLVASFYITLTLIGLNFVLLS